MTENMDAVERAEQIISKYRELSGPHYREPQQTVLEDLMADLRHYAHHLGIDWTKAVDMAELHFEEEREV